MEKSTQLYWVRGQLGLYGEISRNQCLKNYISRLGAIIHKLKAQGFEFTTENRSGDYWYIVSKRP